MPLKLEPEERRSCAIRFRITQDEFDDLEFMAKHHGVTKSDLIRHFIREGMESYKADQGVDA
jgi:predicted DNA-binding protein